MKKGLALLLTAALTISMAACGTKEPANTDNNVQESENTADNKTENNGDKTVIRFINGFTGGDGAFMTKIVDGFNESQDKYFVEQLQDADHYTKFKSDNTYDMLIIHADWISTYHELGLLREVSDIYDAAGISFENDFHDITKTYAKYDDGIYAFPLDLYAETFFYNKELVGDDVPENYQDLIALRDKLDSENTNIYPLSIPLTGDHQWGWMTALGQSGVNWVEDGHVKIDTQEACDAFMKIHDLIYVDKLSAAGLGANAHTDSFIAEASDGANVRAAMVMTGPWNYTSFKEILGDNLAIGTLPQIYGDTKCVPAGGHTFGVSANVTDEDKLAGIAEFFKYVYQPEVLLNWADSGQAPVHFATMELVKADPEKYPVAAVNYTIFDDCMILPAVYNIREQVKYVNETVWAMVVQTEDLSPDDLMVELEKATKIAEELSVK